MLGIYLQAFIYSTVCSQFHTTTKTKPANSTWFLTMMFLINFYRREKPNKITNQKLKRQHDKCLFFNTVSAFIQLFRENLLPSSVSLQSNCFWPGYFVPSGCLQQCFQMTCLLKQSSGASKVLTCKHPYLQHGWQRNSFDSSVNLTNISS